MNKIELKDILKEGAVLTARKITLPEFQEIQKDFEKQLKEIEQRKKIDWDIMNRPMDI